MQPLPREPNASSTPSWSEPPADPIHGLALALAEHERRALVRALYVVKDNWWLDPVEEAVLARLEA